MGSLFKDNFGFGTLLDPFTGEQEKGFRRGARRAAEIPPELQFFLDRLRGLVESRITGGDVRPFVEPPAAPTLALTPLEQQLTAMGQQLAESLGVRPLEASFAASEGLAGGSPRLSLRGIFDEVQPALAPAIANLIERERRGRLDIAEGLANIGAFEGSPLMQARRELAEQTNRDIAQAISDAVIQERALRGQELGQAGELALRTGAAAPVLARQMAGLPRDVAVQEFGLRQAEAEQRQAAIQQVLNLLLGGVGAGTDIFGTRARTLLGGEQLAQAQRAAELDFLGRIIGGGMGLMGGSCWVAAALYGWGTPEFEAARRWLFERWQGPLARVVRALYRRFGRQVATLVRRSPLARRLVKPFFDWAVQKGA